MRVIYIFLSLCFLVHMDCFAQDENKKKIKLYIGALYRITPVYLEGPLSFYIPRHKVFIDADRQLINGGISLGLMYFFSKSDYYFQYNQIIRYGYIHNGNLYDTTIGVLPSKNGLMTDFQFSINRNFHSKKNNFIIGIGYSAMNRGTSYGYRESPSPGFLWTSVYDLYFSAFNLHLGLEVEKKIKIELVNYFTNKTNFNDPGKLLIFEFRVGCIL